MNQQRIKLLLISRPGIGGAAKYISMLAEIINKEMFDVTIICSSLDDRSYITRLQRLGVTVRVVDMKRPISPFSDLKAFWKILTFLNQGNYDIVHAHTAKPGVLGRVAARMARVPRVLYTPHGFYFNYNIPPFKKLFYLTVERLMGRLTDCFILTSKNEYYQVVKEKITLPERVVIIENAVDLKTYNGPFDVESKRRELGIPLTERVVISVGRLSQPKDPNTLLKAAAQVLQIIPNVTFLLVGEGEFKKQAQKLCEQLMISQKVLILGYRSDVPQLLALSDVSVLSSRWEGMPLALLESMAAGKPTVATAVSGCLDVVLEGKTGFLVPPLDSAALSKRLILLLQNKRLLERMGQMARAEAMRRFDASVWIKKLEEVYAKVALTV